MLPSITIIIPVKPGGRVRALDALTAVEYPRPLLDVIVAEGNSPSRQRNRAAREARGDILYFLDDDSMVSPGMLQAVVAHYADAKVAAVGGPSLTPAGDSMLQQSIGAALGSLVGGGKVRNRYRRVGSARATADHELILCNLSFRREVFLASGGLDERLYPNEENELMERLRFDGWRLIHDPCLAVERSQRPTYRAFVRQLFSYGRGRAEQTRISGRISPASLLPVLLLLYLAMLPFAQNPVYSVPLLCYGGAVLASAGWEALQRRRFEFFPLLMLLLPTLHLAYGAGMIMGALSPRYLRSKEPATVTLKRFEIGG
ncbi:MAG: glycosyltransferase [Geobacter sp.]|nr:glycosyltransferase [Geobacter sp.]